MTLRTTHPVRCACGHEGAIRLSENDQPYSACDERYSLVGLRGTDANYTRMADWPEVFERMQISCPACNAKLSPSDLIKHQ